MNGPRLPIRHMVRVAAAWYGYEPRELLSPKRVQRFCIPRFAVAYVAIRHLHYETTTTARAIGRNDHSTAIHAAERGAYLYGRDGDFTELVDTLRQLADGYASQGRHVVEQWLANYDPLPPAAVTADIADRAIMPAPVQPAPIEVVDDEDADAFADWPTQSERTLGNWARGTAALIGAIRAAHPERCAA